MPDLSLTDLDDLAVIDLRGPDAVAFLQGQVSQDLTRLASRGSLLAGLHNPQGRVLALLRLLHLADDHLLMVLPAAVSDSVQQLLTRYVLRAKVKLADAGSNWRVYGVTGPDAAAVATTRLAMPMEPGGMRQLIVAPRGEPMPEGEPADRESWALDDIAAGVPEIVAATSGLFVAQMLNLDHLDAISFSKGCYTGQEVIARAHYRGQVKRRMQRYTTPARVELVPSERILLADGRSAQIVMASPNDGGEQEFLAVAPPPPGAADESPGLLEESAAQILRCTQLPLPYAPLP
jgi:folate-binding protein YgfZ